MLWFFNQMFPKSSFLNSQSVRKLQNASSETSPNELWQLQFRSKSRKLGNVCLGRKRTIPCLETWRQPMIPNIIFFRNYVYKFLRMQLHENSPECNFIKILQNETSWKFSRMQLHENSPECNFMKILQMQLRVYNAKPYWPSVLVRNFSCFWNVFRRFAGAPALSSDKLE